MVRLHSTAAWISPQRSQQCDVCSTVKRRLEDCRGREQRQRRLSRRLLCVCVLRWRVLRHQREIKQTFKGTVQRGVLAHCWFGQLAYLHTQPRLTGQARTNTASSATEDERAMWRPALHQTDTHSTRKSREWDFFLNDFYLILLLTIIVWVALTSGKSILITGTL